MPPLSNIQSIITYYQPNPPDGLVSAGDIWYNPDDREAFIFVNDVWQRVEITPITPGHVFGYSIGGQITSSATSTTNRIQFPFDSGVADIVGNISEPLNHMSSCSSSQYGYVMGGDNVSHIQRFDYPFDSGSATNRGTMQSEKYSSAGFSDTYSGFIVGGTTGGSPVVDEVEEFSFPFDTGKSLIVSQLDDDSRLAMGACESSRFGYVFGGIDESTSPDIYVDYIDRFEFPFHSGNVEQFVASLSNSRTYNASCNSTKHGYSIGGVEPGSPSLDYVKTVDRIEFANDSSAIEVGSLDSTRHHLAACNSTRFGYAMGGQRTAVNGLSNIDRFEFPFSSGTAIDVGNLSSTRFNNVGLDGTQFWF